MRDREILLAREMALTDGVKPGSGLAKHRKMTLSPFVFFRGSAQLFYVDLANGLIEIPRPLLQLPLTTIMGDCHSSNFGFLTEEGSHGDKVIFAPNDFDDACIGHAAWDLLRYCCSLLLCAEHCQGMLQGRYTSGEEFAGKPVVSNEQVTQAIDGFLTAYVGVCQQGVQGREHLADAIDVIDPASSLIKPYLKAVSRAAGGEAFRVKSALAKAADLTKSPPRFRQLAARFKRLDKAHYEVLSSVFAPYMDDAILDIVQRLDAGTGSVNMQRFYFLVGPKDYKDDQDLALCHVVEVKQQRAAAALRHFPDLHPANHLNPAHLTVMCQRRMQRNPDLVLDEAEWNQQHWLIRSRHHAKLGFDPEDIALGKRNVKKAGFVEYASTCGKALALAHCRGDRRSIRFERAVCQLLPLHSEGLITAAKKYAAQVQEDHAWLSRTENLTEDSPPRS